MAQKENGPLLRKTRKIGHYEKRFGALAVERGYITEDQLVEALARQVRENMRQGTHRLIGTILLDMDLLTAYQVEDTVRAVLNDRDNRSRERRAETGPPPYILKQ